jgi:hypothetical protein
LASYGSRRHGPKFDATWFETKTWTDSVDCDQIRHHLEGFD